jgi:hypothetical protein
LNWCTAVKYLISLLNYVWSVMHWCRWSYFPGILSSLSFLYYIYTALDREKGVETALIPSNQQYNIDPIVGDLQRKTTLATKLPHIIIRLINVFKYWWCDVKYVSPITCTIYSFLTFPWYTRCTRKHTITIIIHVQYIWQSLKLYLKIKFILNVNILKHIILISPSYLLSWIK